MPLRRRRLLAKLAPLGRHRWPVIVTLLAGLAMTASAFHLAVQGERRAYAEAARTATENRYAALRREIDALLAALEQARLLAGSSITARRRLVAEYGSLVAPGGIIAGADWVEARECSVAARAESDRCRVVLEARETGAVTLASLPAEESGPGERTHLAAAIPFYEEEGPHDVARRRNRFSGTVLIRLSPRELLEQSISYLQPAGLHVLYYAEDRSGALRSLATHRSRLGGVLPPSGHTAEFKRVWLAGGLSMELHCEPVQHWSRALVSWRTWALLLAGLLTTATAAAYAHWMQSRTRRISEVIHRRTARLRIANRAAKAASRAKSQFLANMSHELRTPIGAIVGMSDMLRAGADPRSEQEAVEAIRSSARQLTHLINNILDYFKLEAGHFWSSPSEFQPSHLVAEIAGQFSIQAQMVGLRLVTECDPALPRIVRADENHIRQILYNLLANALRFTFEGEITLSARIAPAGTASAGISPAGIAAARGSPTPGDTMLEFCVSDTGLGINAGDRERIFHAFVQVDSSDTRRFGGTGLGLAICRLLAEGMRGEIAVESTPGSGSRFCLHIPFETVEGSPHPATPAQPAAAQPATAVQPAAALPATTAATSRHLLLVEDNALNQLVLSRLLERLGCSVEVASNGRVALECVKTQAYDAILMDCQMPVLDGYDTTRAIRGMPEPACATPIMGVTASAGERDRDRCLEAGMDDYLPKPVTLESLRRALDRLCGRPGQLSDRSAVPPLPDAASR